MQLSDLKLDSSWTLFLDRDGVLNRRIVDGYVRIPEELVVLPGIPESVARLNRIFGRTVVVTNQRGIGIGYMTESELEKVHEALQRQLAAAGASIDAIYHCPHDRDEDCGCRKPYTGMAIQAMKQFPEIDPRKTIMVGDTRSDMQFGRTLGAVCVWIDTGHRDKLPDDYDFRFRSLSEFADAILSTGI